MKYGPNSIMNPEGNEEVRELYYECAECACCKIKGKPNEFASLEDLRCHLAINHFRNFFAVQLLMQFREFGGPNRFDKEHFCYFCYFEVGDSLEVEPFNDFSDLLSHIGMVHGEKVDEYAKNLGMTLEQKERVKIIKVSNPKVQTSTPIKYGPNFDFSAQENPKDLFHDESDAEIEENFCSCCTLPAKPGQKLSACGFCNIATYCSLRCQFYDFKGHKKACEFGRKSNGIRKLDVNFFLEVNPSPPDKSMEFEISFKRHGSLEEVIKKLPRLTTGIAGGSVQRDRTKEKRKFTREDLSKSLRELGVHDGSYVSLLGEKRPRK